MEEMVITGSRIRRPELTSNVPVAVVNPEEFRLTGTVTVEQTLNALPQIVPGLNSNTNNGSDGTAETDLRGLGRDRTLVLVNGRRFTPATLGGSVDLNSIPANLIERTEVLTGGASTTYGSDAISGVVNFILKEDFEGAEFYTQGRITDEDDGDEYTVGGTLGANVGNGRGNATVSASYTRREETFQSARDFSAVTIADLGGFLGPQGSFTNAPGRFGQSATNPTPGGGPSFGLTFDENNNLRPFVQPTATSLGDTFNFAPDNYLQTPLQRVVISGTSHYDILENVRVRLNVNYAQNRTSQELAPTPVTGFSVPNTNVFIPAALRAELNQRPNPNGAIPAVRRTVEIGPRVNTDENNQYNIVFVTEAEFFGLNFDASYNYGRFSSVESQTGNVSRSRLNQSLDSIIGPNGTPVCRNAAGGCVPVNIFGFNTITPEAADFIDTGTNFAEQVFEQTVIQGNVTGDLFELPAGPVGFAAGIEYRSPNGSFQADDVASGSDIVGFNSAPPQSGFFGVYELYGETVIPVVKDKPFVNYLEIEGGVRVSEYTTVGTTVAFKGGGTWEPVDTFRIRGQFNRAVRAPNIGELFLPLTEAFPSAIVDPCAVNSAFRTGPNAAQVEALCVATGLPQAALPSFTSSAQIRTLTGGNTDLSEERSNTWTVGAVLTTIPNLSVTVDYFNITITDAIDAFGGGAQNILNTCYTLLDISSVFCQAINRDSGTGRLDIGEANVSLQLANVAVNATSGIDVGFTYDVALDELGLADQGDLRFQFLGTWLQSFTELADPTAEELEFAGSVGGDNGQGLPSFRLNLRSSYTRGAFSFSHRLQWFSESDFRSVRNGADPATLAVPRIEDYFLHDLTVSYQALENLQLTAGMLNVADRDPPIVPGAISANTSTSLYDVLGRRFFVSANVKF